MIKIARYISKEFHPESQKGKEFIKLWQSGNRDGLQNKLSAHFGISIPTVYKIRKKLNLPSLHSPEHPGRRKLIKRIKKLYISKERSTLQIGKIIGMNDENVRKILLKENIELRPSHITNPKYIPTSCKTMTHHNLLKEIKTHYVDKKLSAEEIGKKFNIDPGTVCRKLKSMNIPLRQGHSKVLNGGYRCHWCGTVMEKVFQNKGPRKQKFCSSSCRNKAKDYRKLIKGYKQNHSRLQTIEKYLQDVWGKDFNMAKNRLVSVEPCIKNKETHSTPTTTSRPTSSWPDNVTVTSMSAPSR